MSRVIVTKTTYYRVRRRRFGHRDRSFLSNLKRAIRVLCR
jgi:hypothetical protein